MTPENSNAKHSPDLDTHLITLEKRALERWNRGDTKGYLEIYAKDIVYFDPFLEKRKDGIESLTELYNSIDGKIKVDQYEMLNPKVQSVENMAVLTFNLDSVTGTNILKWNCTEVYRKESSGDWKIIQSHWSFTKPD